MLPQNGQPMRLQHQPQPPGMQSFVVPTNTQNSGFDPTNYFASLDPSAAAKQMAALSEAGKVRLANSRVSIPPGVGSSPAPFLGSNSFPQSTDPSLTIGQDATMITGNQSQFQMPNQSFPQFANPAINPSLAESSMSQPNVPIRHQTNPASAQPIAQRQRFLTSLAGLMTKRGTPLPPALTGVPSSFDPNNTMWRGLEPSSTLIGCFRLAGKDIDLFKLWVTVFQSGGGAKFNNENRWQSLLQPFELPDQMAGPQGTSASVAITLAKYYMALLAPFEDFYKANLQNNAKIASANRPQPISGQQPTSPTAGPPGAAQQGFPAQVSPSRGNVSGSMNAPMPMGMPGSMSMPGSMNVPGPMNIPNATGLAAGAMQNIASQVPLPQQLPVPSPVHSQYSGRESLPPTTVPSAGGLLSGISEPQADKNVGQDALHLKRKIDGEDDDTRRSRLKTDPPEGHSVTLPGADTDFTPPSSSKAVSTSQPNPQTNRPRTVPTRKKIEYIPFAREIETHGGRDLHTIEAEMTRITRYRPLRDLNEWGTVDIEALCMSIRSRLPTELSYALTTLTLLSTLRGQAPGTGFPINQCPDLLEEILDLLEDEAFSSTDSEPPVDADIRITTHRELVTIIHEEGIQLFASLKQREDPATGIRQRPENVILTVLNIVNNLAQIHDNALYLAKQERLLDLSLRLCDVTRDETGAPRPTSTSLSLSNLVSLRRLVLDILATLAPAIHLGNLSSKTCPRAAKRAFKLVSSYLVDPAEAVSPYGCAQLSGIPLSGQSKPPAMPDLALDLFTRLCLPDYNREVFAKVVPSSWIWQLFESLVRRLPVSEADFNLIIRESWLLYLERVVMSLYSLAFLAPPSLKERAKAQHNLGFTKIMFRMIQRLLSQPIQTGGSPFIVCVRRAIETMKMVDDSHDSFDSPKAVAPTMAFGMGWDEGGDHSVEKGMGILAGYRGIAWDLLMRRELDTDPVMFSELESMARVG